MTNYEVLRAGLAEAGLKLLGNVGSFTGMIPPRVTGQCASSLHNEVRTESFCVDIDDSELVEKANSDWYHAAVENG